MAGEGAINADAPAGDTAEERVKRDRLVGPVQLDRPFGGAAGQRRVPGTGAIATPTRLSQAKMVGKSWLASVLQTASQISPRGSAD